MTAQEVYQQYRSWLGDGEAVAFSDFLQHPFANVDTFEDERSLVNRLFYLVPSFRGGSLRCFVFFAENEFYKGAQGDLYLAKSSYHPGKLAG